MSALPSGADTAVAQLLAQQGAEVLQRVAATSAERDAAHAAEAQELRAALQKAHCALREAHEAVEEAHGEWVLQGTGGHFGRVCGEQGRARVVSMSKG